MPGRRSLFVAAPPPPPLAFSFGHATVAPCIFLSRNEFEYANSRWLCASVGSAAVVSVANVRTREKRPEGKRRAPEGDEERLLPRILDGVLGFGMPRAFELAYRTPYGIRTARGDERDERLLRFGETDDLPVRRAHT